MSTSTRALLPVVVASLFALVAGSWQQLLPRGPGPDGRTAHAAGYSEAARAVFVFGGTRSNETIKRETHLSEFWKYSVASDSWEQIPASGSWPPKRCEHVAAFSQGENALYMHGGGLCDGSLPAKDHILGDLWRYSVESGEWHQLAPSGAAPSARYLHAAAFSEADRALFIFGGKDPEGDLNDLWKYSVDSNSWDQLRATDRLPNQTITRHTLVYSEADRELFIFAGWRGQEYPVNDLWKYSLVSNEWAPLALSGPRPAPRGEHAAAFAQAERAIYVYGGWPSYEVILDDLWRYSLASDQWQQLEVASQTRPTCRTDHTFLYSEADRALFMFGGTSAHFWGCNMSLPSPEEKNRMDDAWVSDLWKYSVRDAAGKRGEL